MLRAVGTKIQDRFTKLKVSRQRLYQLRHVAAGLCQYCNRKLYSKTKCHKHWRDERERWLLGKAAQEAKNKSPL